MKQVLTIAGSDSGGGAGIQADLKTMCAFGVYGASAITAVTAQNTKGVQDIAVLDQEFVGKQLDSVFVDLDFSGVKTGMLATERIIEVVAEKVKEYGVKNLVVDPVMVATSGDILLEQEAIETLIEELIPLAFVITPNLNEAKVLSGRNISEQITAEELARELYRLGPTYVLVKGGHEDNKLAKDVLYDGEEFTNFTTEKINTTDNHGTGCTLSSAIASNLALGFNIKEAVRKSKEFVTRAIKEGIKVGNGNNPVNHLININD